MRKRKHTASYELSLEIGDDSFIRPPHDAQRNWLLNRFIREAGADLQSLDATARRFVSGEQRSLPADMRTAELRDEVLLRRDHGLSLASVKATIRDMARTLIADR